MHNNRDLACGCCGRLLCPAARRTSKLPCALALVPPQSRAGIILVVRVSGVQGHQGSASAESRSWGHMPAELGLKSVARDTACRLRQPHSSPCPTLLLLLTFSVPKKAPPPLTLRSTGPWTLHTGRQIGQSLLKVVPPAVTILSARPCPLRDDSSTPAYFSPSCDS